MRTNLGEGVLADEVQGFSCMSATGGVSHTIDGRNEVWLGDMVVQPELVPGVRIESGHSDMDASVADVEIVGKLLNKVFDLIEVCRSHRAG